MATIYHTSYHTHARTYTHVRWGTLTRLWEIKCLEIITERVLKRFSNRKNNMRGRVLQANCSKLSQRKKTTFHQLFLCLHGGWQRFGCRVFLPSECDRATKTKQKKNALSSVWNNLPRTQTACLLLTVSPCVSQQTARSWRSLYLFFYLFFYFIFIF